MNTFLKSSLLRISMAIFFRSCSHLVGVGREIDTDIHGGHRVVDAHVGNGRDLRIWNDVERAIAIAQGGLAQGHGFDDTRDSGDPDGVAHIELVFEQNHDSVQHVAHDVLRSQADGDACNSGRSQQRGKIDSHRSQELHDDNCGDDGHPGGANHARHRPDLPDAAMRDRVRFGDADHASS